MTLPDPNSGDDRQFDTSTCSTCGELSSFIDDRPGANPVGYCANHLPNDLRLLAASGQLTVAGEQSQDEEPLELSQEEQTEQKVEKAATKVEKAASRRGPAGGSAG